VDGLLARHGGRLHTAPEELAVQVHESFLDSNVGLVRHFTVARDLGITRNFLLSTFVSSWPPDAVPEEVSRGYKLVAVSADDGERVVIDWLDDASWEGIVKNLRETAALAREAGAIGLAYDIECYGCRGYYQSTRYAYDAAQAKRLLAAVENRGRQIATAITKGLPDAEIIWLAGYTADRQDINTALVRGITSVRTGGFHLCTERTYFQTRADQISDVYERTRAFLLSNAEDFSRSACTVAPGSMPVFAGHQRQLSPTDVVTQFQQFARLKPRPKYVWVYPGWYPFWDPEFEGYRRAFAGY
jgi:hypothetical protein